MKITGLYFTTMLVSHTSMYQNVIQTMTITNKKYFVQRMKLTRFLH